MEESKGCASRVKGFTHPKSGILTITYPVVGGRVVNWDDWEKVLNDTFYNQLRVAPEEHAVILLVRAGATAAEIEKITQIMFETFNVPSLLLMTTAELALYKAGIFNNDGVVIESGDDLTQIVAIRNGRIVAVKDILYGGANVNGWLFNKMNEMSIITKDNTRFIKEHYCYVSTRPLQRLNEDPSQLTSYTYVDPKLGNTCKLTKELFLAPETIFTPSLTTGPESERKPLIDEIYDTVLSTDTNPIVALSLLSNVIIAGGNTWFPGFKERLEHDLRVKLESKGFCKVTSYPKQAVAYWRSVPLSTIIKRKFDNRWITTELYNNEGPSIASSRKLGLYIVNPDQ